MIWLVENVQIFKNDFFEMAVRQNGNEIEFDVESVALGLNWYEVKKDRKYVMWKRVNKFLSELGFSALVQKGDFIPESYVYLLMMKANNDAAIDFQKFIAFDVLPAIRKDGLYISEDATHEQIKFNIDSFMANIDDYNISKLYNLIEEFLSFHREKKTRLPYERKSSKRHGNKKYKEHIESMEIIRDQLVDFLNAKIDQFNGTNQAGLAQEYVRIREMVRVKVENMRYRTAACR